MPGISDPGHRLLRACQQRGVPYTVIPGASSLLTGLIGSGFSAEQFGLSIPEMVKLYEALPLKEAVVEKWLYGNAKRVLRLD